MELAPRARLRRLAKLLLLAGGAAVVVPMLLEAPRDVTIDLRFGAARAGLRGVSLAYTPSGGLMQPDLDGEIARRATFRYAHGAPDAQRHVARLRPGDYALTITLDYG
ncbi:MAG: hypothetical protein AABZ30_12800, partial [Myxococcota bacterium]